VVTIRQQFGDAIAAALGDGITVVPYAKALDAIALPVVMLERTTVAKPSNAMGGYLVTFTVHVVSPIIGRDVADDELDDVLDQVLLALDGITWCHWTTATRSVFLDAYPSYQVNVQTVTTKTEGI
jgi:hypothetical protein